MEQASLFTSLSDRYISRQFEKIKSTESGEISKLGKATSAHMNVTLLKCSLRNSFCKSSMVWMRFTYIFCISMNLGGWDVGNIF